MSNREAQILAALGENTSSDPKSINLLIDDENSESKGGEEEEEDVDVLIFDNADDKENDEKPQISSRKEAKSEQAIPIDKKNNETSKESSRKKNVEKGNDKPIQEDEFMIEVENSDEEVLEVHKEVLEKKNLNKNNSSSTSKEKMAYGAQPLEKYASRNGGSFSNDDSTNFSNGDSVYSSKETEKNPSLSSTVKLKVEVQEEKKNTNVASIGFKSNLSQKVGGTSGVKG